MLHIPCSGRRPIQLRVRRKIKVASTAIPQQLPAADGRSQLVLCRPRTRRLPTPLRFWVPRRPSLCPLRPIPIANWLSQDTTIFSGRLLHFGVSEYFAQSKASERALSASPSAVDGALDAGSAKLKRSLGQRAAAATDQHSRSPTSPARPRHRRGYRRRCAYLPR